MSDRPGQEGAEERALYGEFRELTEGKPLVDSLRNAALIFGALQTVTKVSSKSGLYPSITS